MGDGNLPLAAVHELEQRFHSPAGEARVSVKSCGVCLSLV